MAVFSVCWHCYDFEAAAAHEVGHLLGLGHPDKPAGSELQAGYPMANATYYNDYLVKGYPTNYTYCQHPWDNVLAGVPDSFPEEELRGSGRVRPSIMESLTTHNPSVCLFQDDYEGLMTLYPVCGLAPPEPRCEKSARNLGIIRMMMFVLLPLLLAFALSILLHAAVDRQRRKWYIEKQAARARQVAAELAAAADPNEENNAAASIQARIRGRNARLNKVAPTKDDDPATPAGRPGMGDSGAGLALASTDATATRQQHVMQKRGDAEVMQIEDTPDAPKRPNVVEF